jgi:hypothetical protein
MHLDFPTEIDDTPTPQQLSDIDGGLQNLLFQFGCKGFLELVAKAIDGHADGHLNSLDYLEGTEAECDEEAKIRATSAKVTKLANRIMNISASLKAGY